MQMESQLTSNPKDYLINKEQFQKIQCVICLEKSLYMLRCKTCKLYLCNQCAIDQKTKQNKCPFRCSTQQLSLEQVNQRDMRFYCPYSKNCKIILQSTQQFQQHDRFCQYISPTQKQQKSHKWTFTCQKNHPLEIKIDTYKKLIQRVKCSQCSEVVISRALCRKCDTNYCNYCRPLPLVQNKCPIGHELVRRKVSTLHYRCDFCQLSPLIFGVDIYDDFICNFGICELCKQSWPQFLEQVSYIKNSDTLCDFVGSVEIVKKLSQNEYNNLKQQHRLQITGKKVLNICGRCQKEKYCFKICKKCDKYYCLDCKKFQVFQNLKCQFGHQFKQILKQNEGQNNNQQLEKQTQTCLYCAIKIPKIESSEKKLYTDQICKAAFCEQCFEYLINYNFDVYYKHISFNVSTCTQEPSHILFFLPVNRQIFYGCTSCAKLSAAKMNCGMCKVPKFYCSSCIPPSNLSKCYCGKEFNEKDILSNYKQCSICLKHCDTYVCQPCGYAICNTCKENKQKEVDLQENQMKMNKQ